MGAFKAPAELSRELQAALSKKFHKAGYRVGIHPGGRYDRLVIQNLAVMTPPSVLALVDRTSGEISAPARFDPWKSPQRRRNTREPIVRYRVSQEEEFRRFLADADPYGSFLQYDFSFPEEA